MFTGNGIKIFTGESPALTCAIIDKYLLMNVRGGV